jgi:hypothetical protein
MRWLILVVAASSMGFAADRRMRIDGVELTPPNLKVRFRVPSNCPITDIHLVLDGVELAEPPLARSEHYVAFSVPPRHFGQSHTVQIRACERVSSSLAVLIPPLPR